MKHFTELEIQDSYTFHLFKCEKVGNFPHPLNCKLFYECSLYKHGRYRRFLRKCKIGFVFSTNLGKCTYPQESGRSECSGKGILTTPSRPTSKRILLCYRKNWLFFWIKAMNKTSVDKTSIGVNNKSSSCLLTFVIFFRTSFI